MVNTISTTSMISASPVLTVIQRKQPHAVSATRSRLKTAVPFATKKLDHHEQGHRRREAREETQDEEHPHDELEPRQNGAVETGKHAGQKAVRLDGADELGLVRELSGCGEEERQTDDQPERQEKVGIAKKTPEPCSHNDCLGYHAVLAITPIDAGWRPASLQQRCREGGRRSRVGVA